MRASCGKICNTGGNGGGVDYPPPGLLLCTEGVGDGGNRYDNGREVFCVVGASGAPVWVQYVGSEAWLEKDLEGFHQLAERRMSDMGPKRQRDGTWVYPPIGAALAMVVLEEIGVYISRLQSTATQYIVTLPIMDLCLAAEKNPGMCLSRLWWDQPALDILGIRAGHVAIEGGGVQGRKN